MPNYRDGLSLREVASRTGASYNAVTHWTRQGIKRPDANGWCVRLPYYVAGGQKWVRPSDLRAFLTETAHFRRTGRGRTPYAGYKPRKRAAQTAIPMPEPEYVI